MKRTKSFVVVSVFFQIHIFRYDIYNIGGIFDFFYKSVIKIIGMLHLIPYHHKTMYFPYDFFYPMFLQLKQDEFFRQKYAKKLCIQKIYKVSNFLLKLFLFHQKIYKNYNRKYHSIYAKYDKVVIFDIIHKFSYYNKSKYKRQYHT